MCLGMILNFPCLGIAKLFEFIDFCFLPNLSSFSVVIALNIFSHETLVNSSCCSPIAEALFFCSCVLIFLCSSDWKNSIALSSSSIGDYPINSFKKSAASWFLLDSFTGSSSLLGMFSLPICLNYICFCVM